MHVTATNVFLATIIATSLIVVPVGGMVGSPIVPVFRPILEGNFADPSIIEVDCIIYTFSTTSSGANVPIATQRKGQGMQRLKADSSRPRDAMPTLPKWSTGSIWAPDVMQLADGSFVLYFSGAVAGNESSHCIGAATSKDVIGPYTPIDTALACPLDQGGAIDPSGFTDTDGSLYVVYKIDGNSLSTPGNGSCGNADGKHDTFLMLQQLDSDGTTLQGNPVPLLNRDHNDGPLIEAPSLVKSSSGTYVLFFSSNCYNSALYDTSYATSPSLKGPYTKTTTPLLLPGEYGLLSPGGASVTPDGNTIVYHADLRYSDPEVRQMYLNSIQITGTTVALVQVAY